MGGDAIVGRSTHAPEQARAAEADEDVDYLAVGPVHATPTKPGRPAAGLEYVEWAAANVAQAVVRDRRARRRQRRRGRRGWARPGSWWCARSPRSDEPEAAARGLRAALEGRVGAAQP